MVKKICRGCGQTFEASRKTHQFCSDKCKKRHYRGTQSKDVPRKESDVPLKQTLSGLTPNERMAKAIMALIKDRCSIVGKGAGDYATFILGDTFIKLGMKEVIIGEMCYTLKKD